MVVNKGQRHVLREEIHTDVSTGLSERTWDKGRPFIQKRSQKGH